MDEKVVFSNTSDPTLGNGQQPPMQPISGQQPLASNQTQTTPVQPAGTPPPPITPEQPPIPPNEIPKNRFGIFNNKIVKIVLAGMLALVVLLIVFNIARSFFPSSQSTENVTLTYWGLWEDSKVMEPIIRDFEKQHPNIKVEYSKQDPKRYLERATTRFQNKTGPDILRYHNSWLPLLASELLPLSKDVIAPQEYEKLYFTVVQKDLTRNGAIYGIPYNMDTLALFINKDLFDAAGLTVPKTLDEFIDAAKILTVPDPSSTANARVIKTAGAAMGTFDNVKHAPDIITLFFAQNNVTFSPFSASKERIKGALEYYTAYATSPGENVWDNTKNPSLTAFANGEVAMVFGFSWDIFIIKAANPKLAFEVHPVPQLNPEKKVAVAHYWADGIAKSTDNPEEAGLFMKYLTEKSVQQKIYTEAAKVRPFGPLYPRRDLAESVKDNTLIAPFLQQADYATSSYFASDTQDTGYNLRVNSYLANAVGKILGGVSIESATNELINGVNTVVSPYGL